MEHKERLDVRLAVLRRGWTDEHFGLARKGEVSLSYLGTDVFLSGPARGNRSHRETVDFPWGTPARVIAAAADAWAERRSR